MSLFEGTGNFHGGLTADARRRIGLFLIDPTVERWHEAHSTLVRPFMTVWQAVRALDPTFPTTGRQYDQSGKMVRDWIRIPDSILVARAIRMVVGRAAKSPKKPGRFAPRDKDIR